VLPCREAGDAGPVRDPIGPMSHGRYTGGRARFGFAVGADGVLVEDPAEQEILATARAARARGLSLRDVVAELEERGVRSRAGKPFALAQVARMLAA